VSELVEAASEVQIPAEFIEQAIREIQAQREQKREQQKRARRMRQMLLKVGAGFVAVSVLWSIWTYNSLSKTTSEVEAAWAQVENQLQRRADLIPNLVSVTQAYAKQEQELVSLLVQSREAYLQAVTPNEKAAAIAKVNQSIKRFGDYAAVNPQLQSSQLFINLQYEIAGTENRIACRANALQQCGAKLQPANSAIPNSVLANAFGLKSKSFFQTTTTSASSFAD
jgi:LemA protein